MATALTNQDLIRLHDRLSELIHALHHLTMKTNNEEMQETISELRNRMHEPFMFVIVGEVKAGKSSFINALLGEKISAVAPTPMTDTIQQIVYGEEAEEVVINPALKKLYQPISILREIAIVDTPGTNTIVEHHQEITEKFIPSSDLIVFVFEAKNPYRKSAWDFFDYVREDWRKKVIFILQQKDLLPKNDLETNIEGVEEQARKKGLENAKVFAVSALDEIEGRVEESGFQKLRKYITDNITGGKAPLLKLQNNAEISQTLLNKIRVGVEDREKQWQVDQEFRNDIDKSLNEQLEHSQYQVRNMVNALVEAYDHITENKRHEIKTGLSFFSVLRKAVSSIFSKKESPQRWMEAKIEELEKELTAQWDERLNSGVTEIAASIQQMCKIIELKIDNSTTILKNDHKVFSGIAKERKTIMQELKTTFDQFTKETSNFVNEDLLNSSGSLSPSVATGSGIAVVGLIIATVTKGAVFDITGGVLTGLGLIFAGVTLGLRKGKIMKEYDKEIDKGRDNLKVQLRDKLYLYARTIKERIEDNFTEFDTYLEKEENDLGKFKSTLHSIGEDLLNIEEDMKKVNL